MGILDSLRNALKGHKRQGPSAEDLMDEWEYQDYIRSENPHNWLLNWAEENREKIEEANQDYDDDDESLRSLRRKRRPDDDGQDDEIDWEKQEIHRKAELSMCGALANYYMEQAGLPRKANDFPEYDPLLVPKAELATAKAEAAKSAESQSGGVGSQFSTSNFSQVAEASSPSAPGPGNSTAPGGSSAADFGGTTGGTNCGTGSGFGKGSGMGTGSGLGGGGNA